MDENMIGSNDPEFWSNPPQVQDGKYSVAEGGAIRSYKEYIDSLNVWINGPKQDSFDTAEDYERALENYKKEVYKLAIQGGMSPYAPITAQGEKGQIGFANSYLRSQIKTTEKDIAERLQTGDGDREQQNMQAALQQEQMASDAAAAEQKARQEAAEARGLQLESFQVPYTATVPGPKGRGERTVTKKYTQDEWNAAWQTKTLNEKEKFKSLILGSVDPESPVAATFRNLSLSTDQGAQTFAQLWSEYGMFLSESLRKNKEVLDFNAQEVIKSFAKESSVVAGFQQAGLQQEDTRIAYSQQLRNFMADNGIRLTPDTLDKTIENLVNGRTTYAQEVEKLRDTVLKRMYPEYSDYFDRGYSVRDLADPYMSSYAQILEIDPNKIKLEDQYIQSALKNNMTTRDFEISLRKDPRWENTKNGRDTISNAYLGIMRQFGLRG